MHEIQYDTVKENVDKRQFYTELNQRVKNYQYRETDGNESGGLYSDIRWIDKVFEDEKEATDYIQSIDRHGYDNIAVKFKTFDNSISRPDEMREISAQISRLKTERRQVKETIRIDATQKYIEANQKYQKARQEYIKYKESPISVLLGKDKIKCKHCGTVLYLGNTLSYKCSNCHCNFLPTKLSEKLSSVKDKLDKTYAVYRVESDKHEARFQKAYESNPEVKRITKEIERLEKRWQKLEDAFRKKNACVMWLVKYEFHT